MRPYHSANLKYTPYAGWRIIALAYVAKALGVQFHVHGMPFGASGAPSGKKAALHRVREGTSGETIRVDREGNAYKPARRVVLKAKEA